MKKDLVIICASCFNTDWCFSSKNKKVCTICGSTDIKEVEIDKPPTCIHCGKKWLPKIKGSNIPPLFSYKRNTYYCGCQGMM